MRMFGNLRQYNQKSYVYHEQLLLSYSQKYQQHEAFWITFKNFFNDRLTNRSRPTQN